MLAGLYYYIERQSADFIMVISLARQHLIELVFRHFVTCSHLHEPLCDVCSNVVNTPTVYKETGVEELKHSLLLEEDKLMSVVSQNKKLEKQLLKLRQMALEALERLPPASPGLQDILSTFPKVKKLQFLAPEGFGYLPMHLVQYQILPYCDIGG